MMPELPWSISALVAALAAAACATALLACGRRDRLLRLQAEELRALRRAATLAAADLRQAALRLHGQAGATAPPSADWLRATALACRGCAEDLVAAARRPSTPLLEESVVDLAACVAEAVDAVSASIAPGRRAFRVAMGGCAAVWGDRRALRQALSRVLGEAALSTAEGESIAVTAERPADGGLAVVVADEGHGMGPADEQARVRGDSRGLAGRLALPRALIEAHGGSLEVVAALGAGTRTTLLFPATRVRDATIMVPAGATADTGWRYGVAS